MLEAIRRHSSSLVVKVLFVVLILSFVVWGVADVLAPRGDGQWAAEVGDVTISANAFNREYQEHLRRLGAALGAPVDAAQARAMGLPQTVLDRMVNNTLLDLQAADAGLTVGDDVVRALITADPRFFNAAGQFDPAVFRRALQNAGFSEETFVALLRSEVTRNLILGSITAGLAPPRTVIAFSERQLLEERTGSFITLALAAVPAVPLPDEATLRQFHADNPGLFTAPEFREVTAIILAAGDLAGTLAIADADLRAAYEDRADEFTVPERRSLRHMVFGEEAAAAAAHARLRQGADFATVAGETLGLKPEDTVIDGVARGDLPPDLAAAAFALPLDGLSEPVRSPLGWHLLKVTAILPGSQRGFEEVRDALRAELARERAIEALVDLGNRIEDTLGRGASLEDAAREAGLAAPARFQAVDPQGRDAAGQPIPGLPPKLVETAFSLGEGQESGLIEADGDTFVIVRVDKVTPPAVRPFEAIRLDVQEAWLAERRTELAKQTAEGIAARVRGEGDLARFAAAENLPVATTPPLRRATLDQERQVPAAVAQALFKAAPGETFVVRGADAFYVGRLDRVAPPSVQAVEQQGPQIRQRLARDLTEDVARQYLAALRQQYAVRVNPRLFEDLR